MVKDTVLNLSNDTWHALGPRFKSHLGHGYTLYPLLKVYFPKIIPKGSFINDVTQLGGGVQSMCDTM